MPGAAGRRRALPAIVGRATPAGLFGSCGHSRRPTHAPGTTKRGGAGRDTGVPKPPADVDPVTTGNPAEPVGLGDCVAPGHRGGPSEQWQNLQVSDGHKPRAQATLPASPARAPPSRPLSHHENRRIAQTRLVHEA